MVEFLLNSGANPDAIDDSGVSTMNLAAQRGFANVLESLIKHNALVNHRDMVSGNTPIISASIGGHLDCAKVLVELGGASPNDTDTSGFTPLMAAATQGKTDLLQYLISCKAALDQTNNRGETAGKTKMSLCYTMYCRF